MPKYRIYWRLYINGSDNLEPEWLNNATTVPASTEDQAEDKLIEKVRRDNPDCTGVKITRIDRIGE